MDGLAVQTDTMSEPDVNEPLESLTASADVPAEAMAESPQITPQQVVEAILFSTDSPLPPKRIAEILGVGDARDVRRHVAALNETYERIGASFRIEEIAGGYRMMTRPEYNTWLAKLLRARQESKLSPAALETLAIIAYKQPVTRAEIEAIRGVAAGDMLQRLREVNLIKIVGRAEDLGRPLLYGTTRRFLEVFGLAGLEDLPKVEIFREGIRGAGNMAEIPPPAVHEQPEDVSDEAESVLPGPQPPMMESEA